MRTSIRKKNQAGFTLVELMIVVAIIGILAVLAIYGVSKYMTNAKTGEARNALGQIGKSAVAAFEDEKGDNTVLAPGSLGTKTNHVLCETAVPVPAAVPVNQKYQSSAEPGKDWNTGDSKKGWTCLKFSLTEPQYFQYQYVASDLGFASAANANFSGKAVDKGFALTGGISGSTGQLVLAQQMVEQDTEVTPTIAAAP